MRKINPLRQRFLTATTLCTVAVVLTACGKKTPQEPATATPAPASVAAVAPPSAPALPAPVETSATAATPTAFNLDSIRVSTANMGAFPYFSAPEGTEYINGGGKQVTFDLNHIAIDGKLVPIEGPWFGAYVQAKRGKEWSQRFIDKSYEEFIVGLGGVKIFHGNVPRAEIDRVDALKQLTKTEGSLDYWNDDPISTYVIHRANGAAIYIQVQTNSAGGKIQVAQKGAFKQTIQLLKADELKKALDASGKAVVHVNFDIDQATVLPDGMRAVAEIASVLKSEPQLKLSIEGHTDNSGAKEHNLILSKNRADTVQQLLQLAGVAADRLKTQGLGDEKPLVSNDTDDNKAHNRRVELVKF